MAALKAVDGIPFLTLFQGDQSDVESLHGFMRDRYAMSGQKTCRYLQCFLYIMARNTVYLLLRCDPWSVGFEASNKMPAVPVLQADPVKMLRLSSFCIGSCAA